MSKQLEKHIEKACCEYLEYRGCFPCKIESTGVFDPKSRRFRSVTNPYKRKGISDVMFFWKGKVWFMEVKTPDKLKYIIKHWDRLEKKEVPSKERESNQIQYLHSVRKKEQVGIFVCSLDRLKILMEQTPSNVPFY